MNLQDALQVFGLTGEVNLTDAKNQYRTLCSKFHPDRNPAGLQMMQAINAAWDAIKTAFENDQSVHAKDDTDANYSDDLSDAINAIIDLEGLKIEVCGSWVWVTGGTKKHKEILKAAKFKWAKKKVSWYFRPQNYKSKGRGKFSMDEVRDMHGSQSVTRKSKKQLSKAA